MLKHLLVELGQAVVGQSVVKSPLPLVQSVVRLSGGASRVGLSSTSHSCAPEKSLGNHFRIRELYLRHIPVR
jgi:hypothetical protein